MNAGEILRIPLDQPELLFSGPRVIDDEFKKLAKLWHPDLNRTPDASAVMAHIKALQQRAKEKAKADQWRTPGLFEFKAADGKMYRLSYRLSRDIQEGEMLVSDTKLAYFLEEDYTDLFKQADLHLRNLTYGSERMRQEFSRYMPDVQKSGLTKDGRGFIVMQKRPDVYPLRDVLDHFKGRLPEEHAVWAMSALLNVACYFEYAGITHNALTVDNLFISPDQHEILILGGWWYAQPVGKRLVAVPSAAYAMMAPPETKKPSASPRLDRIMMRAVVRELLGDRAGFKLLAMGVKPAIVQFLRAPLGPSAVRDYAAWRELIETAFGKRRFATMQITPSDIYERT